MFEELNDVIDISLSFAMSLTASAKDYYVQPGTWTIERALQEARLDRLQADPAAAYTLTHQPGENVIHLAAGTYRLSQPIVVRPEDYNTRFVADREVVISGGVQIRNWKKIGKRLVIVGWLISRRSMATR